MTLTTGCLWSESHQSEQTDVSQTGTGQYRCYLGVQCEERGWPGPVLTALPVLAVC